MFTRQVLISKQCLSNQGKLRKELLSLWEMMYRVCLVIPQRDFTPRHWQYLLLARDIALTMEYHQAVIRRQSANTVVSHLSRDLPSLTSVQSHNDDGGPEPTPADGIRSRLRARPVVPTGTSATAPVVTTRDAARRAHRVARANERPVPVSALSPFEDKC